MSAKAIMDQLQTLQPTISGLQGQIEPKLKAAVPTVKLEFPRMTPEMLGGSEPSDEGAIEEGQKLLGDGSSQAEAAMGAAEAKAAQVKAFAMMLFSQVVSLAISVAMGFGSLMLFEADSLVGPLATSLMATITSTLSLRGMLEARTGTIFGGIDKQLKKAKSMLMMVLNTIDDMVMGPVSGVMGTVEEFAKSALTPLGDVKSKVTAIVKEIADTPLPLPDATALKEPLTSASAKVNGLVAQATEAANKIQGDYRDDLKKISSAEATVRKVKPDFDAPDPSDLIKEVEEKVKKPLDIMIKEAGSKVDAVVDTLKPPFDKVNQAREQMKGAVSSFEVPSADPLLEPMKAILEKVKDFIKTAKEEVPGKMTELLGSTTPGLLMTSRWHFDIAFVMLPLGIIFLMNLPVAVFTALHAIQSSPPPPKSDGTPLPVGWLPNTPKGMEMDALKPYYMPVISSIVMAILQFLMTLLLTAKSFACTVVNGMIANFESKLNAQINERIDNAIGALLKQTFDTVGSKVNALTSTLKDALTKVEDILKKAINVEGLRDEAMAMKDKVMSAGKEAAEKVDATIEVEKGKLTEKCKAMEKRIKDSAAMAQTMSNPAAALKGVKKFW